MEFIAQNIFGILGLLAAVISGAWGLIKYFRAQLEAQRTELEDKIAELHSRVNDVRKEYVHQEHLDTFLNGFKEQLGSVVTEGRRTNERLDNLFTILIEGAKKQ